MRRRDQAEEGWKKRIRKKDNQKDTKAETETNTNDVWSVCVPTGCGLFGVRVLCFPSIRFEGALWLIFVGGGEPESLVAPKSKPRPAPGDASQNKSGRDRLGSEKTKRANYRVDL